MGYYFAKSVEGSFEEMIQKTEEALKKEGFGVFARIDVKKTHALQPRQALLPMQRQFAAA
ncbi:MAG: hypothetical protein ACQESB_04870 [Elusimicrobiota bacterium]